MERSHLGRMKGDRGCDGISVGRSHLGRMKGDQVGYRMMAIADGIVAGSNAINICHQAMGY